MERIRTDASSESQAAVALERLNEAGIARLARSVLAVLLFSATWLFCASRVLATNPAPASAPSGELATAAATTPDAPGGTPSESRGEELPEFLSSGADVFVGNCAECHGTDGAGTGAGPRLVGNDILENGPRVTRQVLFGGDMMPSFGTSLSDHQVAAVLTYVRTSWGNSFGVLTEEDVRIERQKFE